MRTAKIFLQNVQFSSQNGPLHFCTARHMRRKNVAKLGSKSFVLFGPAFKVLCGADDSGNAVIFDPATSRLDVETPIHGRKLSAGACVRVAHQQNKNESDPKCSRSRLEVYSLLKNVEETSQKGKERSSATQK